ncbi:hypothetical protein OF83DRAFT_1082513 [Amylostereum chailletii]|nr:hypothetical protein OF83DRAFT_1082513 [Amylostereum chailletii]
MTYSGMPSIAFATIDHGKVQTATINQNTRSMPKVGSRLGSKYYRDVEVEPDEVIADRFWKKYLDRNKKYDKEQIETWRGDADGILIFTGLFSATVAAFIVESYKRLEPDSGDATVVLLSQLVAIVNGTQPRTSPSLPFTAPRTIFDVNILWFFSLILSLTCALGATLVQQWVRNYGQAVFDEHTTPRERGRLRAFLFAGVKRFRLPAVTSALPLLLHISVFLFFSGIVEFLWPINRAVALFTLVLVGIMGSIYAILTIFPLLILNCPYHTPLTPFIWPFIFAVTQIRDVFRLSSVPEGTFRHRARIFLRRSWRRFRSPYSSTYQSLDEYFHTHRSVSRAFGASDVDALAEAARRIPSYLFDDAPEVFAEELPAVVDCCPASSGGAQAIFQVHADAHHIYPIVYSLLLRQYSRSPANRDRRSVVIMKLLSRLNVADSHLLRWRCHSLPAEVRRAVPHIIESTLFTYSHPLVLADIVQRLSCHEHLETAVCARGVFSLAGAAALQNSLSQESNIRDIEPSTIRGLLKAAFPSAHRRPWMQFMADEEGSLANGPCIAALCVLSDLDDGEEGSPFYSAHIAHLHTLALLSTLSRYVKHTAPEVRMEFMRKWEKREARMESGFRNSADNENVVVLLKPLYDALQASEASSSQIQRPALDTIIASQTASVTPPEEQAQNGRDIEVGYMDSQDDDGPGRDYGPASQRGLMSWLRRGSAVHIMEMVTTGLLDKLSDWWRVRRETRSAQGS